MPDCQNTLLQMLAILIASCLYGQTKTNQTPDIHVPDIHLDVTLVRVPFVGTDANGRRVRDLSRDELSVTEDGEPREIKYLWTETDLTLTVALVIDISSSQMGLVRRHRSSAERFIRAVLAASDRALIATLDEQPRLLGPLTSSADELLRAAESVNQEFHGGELFGEPCQPPPQHLHVRGRRECVGTAIWDGAFHLARTELSRHDGRTAVVLLSDGLDLNSSVHGLSSALEAAQSAGVTVYTIRHLSGPYLAIWGPMSIRALREHGMQDIAIQTGGLAFHNPRDLDLVYDEIALDPRSQCVLAYTPSLPAVPGALHRLEVRTTRPGVKMRSQAAYRVP